MNSVYGPQWRYNVVPSVWPNGYPPSCTASASTPVCYPQAVRVYPYNNSHIDTLHDGNGLYKSSSLAGTVGGSGTAANGTMI